MSTIDNGMWLVVRNERRIWLCGYGIPRGKIRSTQGVSRVAKVHLQEGKYHREALERVAVQGVRLHSLNYERTIHNPKMRE